MLNVIVLEMIKEVGVLLCQGLSLCCACSACKGCVPAPLKQVQTLLAHDPVLVIWSTWSEPASFTLHLRHNRASLIVSLYSLGERLHQDYKEATTRVICEEL